QPLVQLAAEERPQAPFGHLARPIQATSFGEQLLQLFDGLLVEATGDLPDRGVRPERYQLSEDVAIHPIGEALRADSFPDGLHVASLVQQHAYELTLGAYPRGPSIRAALLRASPRAGRRVLFPAAALPTRRAARPL